MMTMEAMLTTITLMTGRYKSILKRGERDRNRLLYAAAAVFDKKIGDIMSSEEALEETLKGVQGFAIDKPKEDTIEEDDEDELTMSALDELDAVGAVGLADQPKIRHSIIPMDNFLRLVQLLLLIAPLDALEPVAAYSDQLSEDNLKILRDVATAILASFDVEGRPGITYKAFTAVIPNTLPHLFLGLDALFEHFLYPRDSDPSRTKDTTISAPSSPVQSSQMTAEKQKALPPLLPQDGDILNRAVLSQLSFFITPSTLFRRLHYLYSGNSHGFSLQSLEKHVFTWRAPTILLVTGTLLPANPTNSRERGFVDSLPPKRYPNSMTNGVGKRVTYGIYLTTPWKSTHKSHFGDASTMLFQLSPTHDVFRASTVNTEYGSYTTPTGANLHGGINFGSPLPMSAGSKASATHGSSLSQYVPLGPVSLFLDDSLEFGVFTHTAAGGGSFFPSVSPARTRPAGAQSTAASPTQAADVNTTAAIGPTARRRSRAGSLASQLGSPTSPTSTSSANATPTPATNTRTGSGNNWQDRFEIEALEVWGCGGDEEAVRRKKRIDDEEREARLRREAVAKTGDVDADREILRMAGLIGHDQGGSMG